MEENIYYSIERLFDKVIKKKEDIFQLLENTSINGTNFLLTYFNQHAFNIFWEKEGYRNCLLRSFHVFHDGIGIFSMLFLYKRGIEKLDATDVYNKIFGRVLNNEKYKIAIIGGTEKLHKAILSNSKIKNIVLHKEGNYSGIFISQIAPELEHHKPNIIIIGMGIPLQEKVALQISKIYHNCMIICVGNFLEFYFGTVKRAPVIFQKLGIEWLFRLLTEPGRLWKRYIFGIPEFIFRAIRIKLSGHLEK